ncbi:MAG TPA: lysylphosphatidylglycerol synthase domain-containing protein [Geminicoccaceae bacterium]|nr:lysylphosphatidylglycerol synthase domain-containing protein [Geminicoccus sp.]HMU49915.1 lysylphosphatidylglycerol synthase domain-containing protein [Geminicoccaceae bacterium]
MRAAAGSRPGWRRLLPWVVTPLALVLAGWLLYRTLGRYEPAELWAAVTAVPAARLLGAAAFAATSYFCLTGFDFLATRWVGRPLPYRQVALASFTSLSLGHNIGLAALSSGAVRYRFYTRWGLSAAEVAKLILFCAMTVGLGLVVLGAAALLLQPALAERVTGLARPAVLALGATCLAIPLAYLALSALARAPLRFRSWTLDMPPPRLAVAQLVIGPLNFACVAACLHQTLLAVADLPYLAVASAYVIANVAALVTHVPGGLGVIESVVQYLLPQADLIGALLVFRFVYFLAPLALGSASLVLSEILLRRRAAAFPRHAPAGKPA